MSEDMLPVLCWLYGFVLASMETDIRNVAEGQPLQIKLLKCFDPVLELTDALCNKTIAQIIHS